MQDVAYTVLKENLQQLKSLTFESLKDIGENILSNYIKLNKIRDTID